MRRALALLAVLAIAPSARATSPAVPHWWLVDVGPDRDAALMVDTNSIVTTGAVSRATVALVLRKDEGNVARFEAVVDVECEAKHVRMVSGTMYDATGRRLPEPMDVPEGEASPVARDLMMSGVCPGAPRGAAWADFGATIPVAKVREVLNTPVRDTPARQEATR